MGELKQLRFAVSRDFEHINLWAEDERGECEIGARSHNYPLLALAQSRIADRERGVAEKEAGWMEVDELLCLTKLDRKALNLLLWRSVRSARRRGLTVESLVERRLDAGQLRICVGQIEIRVA